MSPQRIASTIRREVPSLRDDERLVDAVAQIIQIDVPALPVVDARGKLLGIFGEREFIAALFPGYLTTLGYAGFVPRSLDEALEKRATCVDEPVAKHMNTEHIDVGEDFSDTQLAEIFLHHRVLIIPIVDGGRVTGIVTREDFSRALGERLTAPP
ncbi:MAG: CBS domain-containing protein [Solirubrobacteraceae bacterium]|nr:CBS domain-containing protein [Solirubrobacteraceae bacterium]